MVSLPHTDDHIRILPRANCRYLLGWTRILLPDCISLAFSKW